MNHDWMGLLLTGIGIAMAVVIFGFMFYLIAISLNNPGSLW